MRFLRSVYLFTGFCWTIGLAPAAAQQAAPAPANPTRQPTRPTSTAPASTRQGAAPSNPAAPSGSAATGRPASSGTAVGVPAPAVQGAALAGGRGHGDTAASAPAPAEGGAAGGGVPAAAAEGVAVGEGVPAEAAGAPAEAAAAPQPDARGEGARLAKQRGAPVAPTHDAERPPAPPEPEAPSDTGFAARLSLGVGGALWISGGDTKLSRPFWFGLDLGYAFTRNLTIFARGTSWFPYDNLANEFVGVGAAYRFVAERLYIAPALGASFTRQGSASDWSHYFQGLAFEADVGQYFPLTGSTSFSLGAHFQIGTPLFGKKPDAFTSLQAGIFVALGLH